jgi:tetratricopeptide (TPR) repeat protein
MRGSNLKGFIRQLKVVRVLAKIAKYLQPDFRGWGVVLDGPGGIGKTALAVEAAYRAPAEMYPAKLFITAKTNRLTPDGPHRIDTYDFDGYHSLLTAIGVALGRDDIRQQPQTQLTAFIRNLLAGRRVLLVLDNLESLNIAERRAVYDLLELLPITCRALVTSRRRDETAARTLRLDKLDFPACQSLLQQLGENWPPVAKLSAAEQQTLYSETGGNPLLLTWTAGQLGRTQGRCRTVADAVRRLREAQLWRGPNHDEDNDPLEFVFGDLLDTFTDAETAVLAALAHFTEPAKLDWLLPLADLSRTAAQTALDDLHNRALLLEDEANATWLLPALTAQFLRLRRPQAVTTAGERLAAEAYALGVQHGGNSNKAPFTELEQVWPTVQAALPLLLAGDNARLQTVCEVLDQFLNFSGRWDVWLKLSLEAEAKAVAIGDFDNAGWRAYQAGWVYYLQQEADAVLACAERCTTHWQQAQAGVREQAFAVRLRGIGHELREDYPAAIEAYEQSLALHRSLTLESKDIAIGLNDLANAKKASSDCDGAEADYREALRLARKLDYREGVAYMTGNLAELAFERKDWPTAERLAREALGLAKTVGRLELVAGNHQQIAKALLKQQRATEALPHAEKAVETYARLSGSPDLADAQATLAECQAALADE